MASLLEEAQHRAVQKQEKAYHEKLEAKPAEEYPLTERQKEFLYSDPTTKYNVYDASGKVVDTIEGSKAVFDAYREGKQAIKNAEGKYEFSTPRAEISIDQKTGNAVIKAPGNVLSRIQNAGGNYEKIRKELETLSQAYKQNPDYRFVDASDDTKSYSIQDRINELNEVLNGTDTQPGLVSTANAIDAEKDRAKSIDGVDLTDDQVAKRWAVAATGSDGSKPKKSDRQSLPDIPEVRKLLEGKESLYDVNSHTISYGDLMDEVWNRDKNSDEDINAAKKAIADYFEKRDFSDTDKYAEMSAFRDFAAQESPYTSVLRGAADVVSNAAVGIGTGLLQVATTPFYLADALFDTSASFFHGLSTGKLVPGDQTMERQLLDFNLTGMISDIGSKAYGELEKYKEYQSEMNRMIGSEAGSIAFFAGSEVIPFVADVVIGAKGGAAASRLTGKALARTAATNIEKAEAAGKAADSVLRTLSTQGVIDAETMINGQRAIQALRDGEDTARTIARATESLKKPATTLADISTQSVVDAALFEPEVLRDAIEGKGDPASTLWTEFAWNAGAFGALTVGSRAARKIGQTNFGKITGAVATTKINGFAAGIGNLNAKIKTAIYNEDYLDRLTRKAKEARPGTTQASRRANKAEVAQMNASLRKAQQQLGAVKVVKGADTIDEVLKNVEKVRKQATYIRGFHVAIDRAKGGAMRTIGKWLNSDFSPALRRADEAIQDSTAKVIRAEKAMGWKPAVGDKAVNGNRVFSQTTTNYIGATKKAAYLRNKKKLVGLKKAEDEELAALDKMVKKFNSTASRELKSVVDEYIANDYTWWGAFNDMRIREGLISNERVAGLRESGLWGEGGEYYSRTQRQEEYTNYVLMRRDGKLKNDTTTDVDMYSPGSTDNFVDPSLVRYDEMVDTATTDSARELLYWGERATGISGQVRIGGAQTEAAKTIKRLKTTLDSRLFSVHDSLLDTTVQDDLFSKFLDRAMKQGQKGQLAGEVSRRGEQVRRAATIRRATPTLREQRAAVDAFSDTTLKRLSSEVQGQSFDEMLLACEQSPENARAIFDTYFATLDRKTQNYIADRLKRFREDARTGQLSLLDRIEAPTSVAATYDEISQLTKFDPEFAMSVNSQVVKNNMAANLKSVDPRIDAKARAIKADGIRYEARTLHKEAWDNYVRATKASSEAGAPMEELVTEMDSAIDDIVESLKGDNVVKQSIESLRSISGGAEYDDVAEYVLLQAMRSSKGKKNIEKRLNAYLSRESKQLQAIGKSEKDIKASEKLFKEVFTEHIDERFNNARLKLSDSPLVDKGEWMDEIRSIDKEIRGLSKESADTRNIVKTLDSEGRETFVETDPILADLINTRPIPEATNVFGNINYIWSKLFRLGKTGLNIKSWVNQTFRDTLNMFIGGNAWRGFQQSVDDIADCIGRDVESFLRQYSPEEQRIVRELAEESGQSLERTIAERELRMGEASSPAATETEAYRFSDEAKMARFREVADGRLTYDETRLERFGDALDNITRPNGKWYNIFSWNQVREQKLRKLAYDNAFANALAEGYSLKQARVIAGQIMQDATTNFSRRTYHLSNFQKTIPYFGAAVNGTKSFYRLWSLDPVGVTSRLFAGIIAPVMFFTAESLGDPKNRELYKNIPEYAKAENMVFVVDGNVITIPFPQELRGVVAPFRQFMEHLYDADAATFWELATSDALGFSPVDLSGFMNLDANKMLGDVTWMDRMWNGLNKVSAQLMPPYLKSSVMVATGVDPYTGQKIDKTSVYVDPETGDSEVMDYTSGRFAKWVASIFGDSVSAPMAQKILDNIIGTAGIDALDSVSAAASAVASNDANILLEIPSRYAGRIAEPFYQPVYNSEANLLWQQSVTQLESEKEQLLADRELAAKIRTLTDYRTTPEAKKKIQAEIKDAMDPFYDKVKTLTDRFVSEYGGTYDRRKLAQTIALMNFGEDENISLTGYSDALTENQKQLARAQAIQTMQNMGFRSVNDTSIFGYYGRNSQTGEVEVLYTKPLAMQAIATTSYGGPGGLANQIHLANIKSAMDSFRTASGDSLSELKKAAREEINNIYNSKGSYSTRSKAQDKIRNEFNAQVMKAIAPYIQQMTPEAAINNEDVMDYLEDYIMVPDSYKKNKRGRYPSLGSRGNAQSAYVENYIRYIFDIKDIYGRGEEK